MIYVRKGEQKFPFSRGILARSISRSGLSISKSYEIVRDIKSDLQEGGIEEIKSDELKDIVCEKLLERGRKKEERYYRVRREIKYLDEPIFVLVGGGPGVGKSSISIDVGHRLGISRVIGTDTIREIMRSILPENLVPTLHASTFMAKDKLRAPGVSNKLIHAFEEQTRLVCEGISAVMKRGEKEGLSMILDGVHMVPGFVESSLNRNPKYFFRYVIDVPDREQHIQHFYAREESSRRDPERYVDEIDNIRGIHEYIMEMAEREGVKIIENKSYDETLETILKDVMTKLEEEI